MNGSPVTATLGKSIAKKVLASSSDPVAEIVTLQAAHIGRPDSAREDRVFAVGLFYPAPARIAGDIQNRSKSLAGTHCQHLRANHPRHLLDKGGVPARSQADALR